jgi:hypothetical protein
MQTIDITPTPEAYRKMLQVIIDNTTSKADRYWATVELERVKDVKEWSK